MKYLIIIFILFANLLSAQVIKIDGWILNSSDKSPISFVNVLVDDSIVVATTDENGFFSFRRKFDKDEQFVLSHIGYEVKKLKLGDFLNSESHQILLTSKIITSQTILVKGSIGEKGVTPLTFSKLDQASISKLYTTQDIPEMLSNLPSTTFYSENGNGIGYNYLSIRGFDQRRISVSVNGIPQNDPEDHNVYWLDFPDLLESTELIQVQRGAGSGVIGYPAVGGSINIITSSFSDKPRMEFSASVGAFNTRKYSAEFSSGLISNKYSVYMKLSELISSGYRNFSWVDLKSFHLSAARYDANVTTQINIYGGPIADGLAYTGLPKFAIKDKTLRKANYSYWEADDKRFTYTLERRPEEIENFSQPHFELLNEIKLSNNVLFNSTLFLVIGKGYFDYDGSWADTSYLRLTNQNGFNPTKNPGNVLIRAMVENTQWGWIPRLSIKHDNGELVIGAEYRNHRSIHWGSVEYGEGLPTGLTQSFRYYLYHGGKDIVNLFLHEDYNLNNKIKLLLEGQFSFTRYLLFEEKYVGTDFKIENTFFNPRIGINYQVTPQSSIYLTLSRVSREPRLVNYYDAAESSGGAAPQFALNGNGSYDFKNPLVKPETMNDIEIGSSFTDDNISLSFNIYYMLFKDEIVQQGQVDRFGQPITGNMNQTIHYGGEASASIKLNKYFEIVFNGSVSKNYISKGDKYFSINGADAGEVSVLKLNMENNPISGFPNTTMNCILKMNYNDLFLQLTGKYVGEFFTDNYGTDLAKLNNDYPRLIGYNDNKVDSYFVTNLFASYKFELSPLAKEIKLFFQVNNLFDNLYAAYGIGKEFFPAAERNILFGIKLGL
jgi:iron complex outermembrane receptor protein